MVTKRKTPKRDANAKRWGALAQNSFAAVMVVALYVSYVAMYMIPLQKFAYVGTYSIDIDAFMIAFGVVLCIVVAILLPKETNAKSLFIWFLFLTMIVPRAVLVGCRGDEPWYALLCLVAFAVAAFMGLGFGSWSLPPRFNHALSKKSVSVSIVAVISAAVLALLLYMLFTMGLPSLDAFDYRNTYDIRDENEASFGYFQSAALSLAGVRIVPALICFFLAVGLPWFALGATAVQLVLFLWTANKAWLLTAAMIWLLYLLVSKRWMTVLAVLSAYTIIMLVIAIVSCAITESVPFVIFSILVRRLIFVPAIIGDGYFHFFLDDNPLILFQSTVLSVFTPMPDQYAETDFVVQVGQFLYGEKTITNANSGLFGGEIANFGPWLGFVAMTLNLMIICKLFSFKGSAMARRYIEVMAVVAAFLLLNVSSVRFLFSPTGLMGTMVFLVLLFLADCGFWSKSQNGMASDSGQSQSG